MRNELLLGSVAVITLTSLSIDASAQSNVKAALLDMSAIVGMGTVGMMIPGRMGGWHDGTRPDGTRRYGQ